MSNLEKVRVINKVIRETNKEGIKASVKSFALDLLGRAAIVIGTGMGFFGFGGEITVAGKVIGFLALTMGGAYILTKSKEYTKKAVSAFEEEKEIGLCVGKQTLKEQDIAR
jgi:hypothetical protein